MTEPEIHLHTITSFCKDCGQTLQVMFYSRWADLWPEVEEHYRQTNAAWHRERCAGWRCKAYQAAFGMLYEKRTGE